MSARVFTPVQMTELSRLHASRTMMDRVIQSSPSASPNVTDIARARRHLFGPIDHDETKRFVEQELAEQQQIDSDRWGFDFFHDKPKMGHAKYAWEIIASDKVPDVYTGTRTRILPRPIPRTPSKICWPTMAGNSGGHHFNVIDEIRQSTTNLAATMLTVTDILDSVDTTEHLDTETTPPTLLLPTEKQNVEQNLTRKEIHNHNTNVTTVPQVKATTQPRITDYMKSRKRPCTAFVSSSSHVSKNISNSPTSSSIESPTPIKIARRIQFS